MKKFIHLIFYWVELILIAIIYLAFAKDHISFTPYVTYPVAIAVAFIPIGIISAIACVVFSFFYDINAYIVNLSYLFIVIYLIGIWLTSLFKDKKQI